jgi:hypothetical protein
MTPRGASISQVTGIIWATYLKKRSIESSRTTGPEKKIDAMFLISPLGSLRPLGFAPVVAITVDAVVVRPVLVPCGHWLLHRRRRRRRPALAAAIPPVDRPVVMAD